MHQTVCRQSYTIHEIATMRSMSEQAVLDDIYHGQLKAHIWLPMMVIEECKKYRIEDKVLYEHNQRPYEGYVALYPRDVRQIMRRDKVILRSFPGDEDDIEINIKSGAPDYHVMKNDILILQESLSHLKLKAKEKHQDIRVTAIARLDEIWPQLRSKPAPQTTYDPLFQAITFNDTEYNLGQVQAQIVKQLYDAHQAGQSRVHFKTLIESAGAKSMTMRDIFRSQPRWKDLIHSNGRGYYWLNAAFFN